MGRIFYKYDRFGVRQWRNSVLLLCSFIFILATCCLNAWLILDAEIQAGSGGNVNDMQDALWLMIMATTTVGFGDVYPVSGIGRIFTGFQSYIGLTVLGFLGGITFKALFGFFETDVENSELRNMNAELLRKVNNMEVKFDLTTKSVDIHTHGINHVIEQKTITDGKEDTIYTFGVDDSKFYVIAVNGYHNGFPYCSWYVRKDFADSKELFYHLIKHNAQSAENSRPLKKLFTKK